MKLTNYFQPSRFWRLFKLELFRSRRAVGLTFVITFGLLFFMSMMLGLLIETNKLYYGHQENYSFSLLLGGFILSSLAFSDLGSTLKRYHYLTLPVSAFERFFCMWLLTSIGWIILYTVTYTLYALFANQIGNLLFSRITFQPFNPINPGAFLAMKTYFTVQGIFLVGAAHFRGYVLPKTLFTIILVGLVGCIIAYYMIGNLMDATEEVFERTNPLTGMASGQFWEVTKWVFAWILAPLSWVIAYFGIKEQEA